MKVGNIVQNVINKTKGVLSKKHIITLVAAVSLFATCKNNKTQTDTDILDKNTITNIDNENTGGKEKSELYNNEDKKQNNLGYGYEEKNGSIFFLGNKLQGADLASFEAVGILNIDNGEGEMPPTVRKDKNGFRVDGKLVGKQKIGDPNLKSIDFNGENVEILWL